MIIPFELPTKNSAFSEATIVAFPREAEISRISPAYFWTQIQAYAQDKCRQIRATFQSDGDVGPQLASQTGLFVSDRFAEAGESCRPPQDAA